MGPKQGGDDEINDVESEIKIGRVGKKLGKLETFVERVADMIKTSEIF